MSENNRSVRTIFSEALEIADAQQRAEYLAQACGADTALRQSVQELIQAHEAAGRFLGGPEESVGPGGRNVPAAILPATKPDGRTHRYFGDYELLEEIARGGMGIIFKARQTTLNRTVALKMILAGKLASPSLVQRFHAEAEAAANLKHANIVAIHEVGEHEGQHYFSMDYIDGQDLAQRMAQGLMPLKEAAHCVQTIAEAIHYAHQRGVLHRDLKPSNILLDRQGRPHVSDFGLAKLVEPGSILTHSEAVMGTPSYMAPEQAAGDMKQLTTAADIYSLGAILYELLTGRPPFRGGTALETMRQVMEEEPEPPSQRRKEASTHQRPAISEPSDAPRRETDDRLVNAARCSSIDKDLETICLKCLQKDPNARYGSAEALAKDLARWQADEPILARSVTPAEKVWRWCRRNPKTAVLSAAVILLVLTVAIGSTLAAVRIRKAQRAATEELFDSYLAQARAARFSGQPGRRFDSLDVLAKAAAIRLAPELRDEAIACLALPDLRLNRRLEAKLGVFDRTLQRYAVAATNLGNISIRRVSDDQDLLLLPSPPGTVQRIASFSHDGKYLPVLCRDHQLRVWDLEHRTVLLTVPCATRHESVDFQPDDHALAVAAGGAEVSIYELATGEKLKSFVTPFAAMCVRYDPSGQKVAISSFRDHRVAILDPRSGATLSLLTCRGGLGEVAWHPRHACLAAAGKDELIYVWDTATGQLLHVLKGHQSEPGNVAFNRDGDILISSGWDGTHLWHTRTGEHLLNSDAPADLASFAPDDGTYGHHRYDATPSHIAPSIELLSFASGREARRWHAAEEDNGSKVIAFSWDGGWLAFGAGDFVKLFETRTGDLLATLPTGRAAGACFQKNGGGLLVSGERGLFLWPIRAGRGAGEFSIGPPRAVGSAGAWQQATLSENGQVFAAFHGDHVSIFDPTSMRKLSSSGWCGRRDQFHYISVSPDGQWVATGGWHDRVVKIWDARTGAPIKELADPEWIPEGTPCPAFEPDGRSLVITCWGSYRVWETNSWTPGVRVPRSDAAVVAISHRSGLMATRDRQTSIQLRDLATGEVLATLKSPLRNLVAELAFSPDDTQLAVAHWGTRELLVWDLRLLRQQLAKMGLDWNRPPYPPEAGKTEFKPTRIILLGEESPLATEPQPPVK
jgi:serine/threonine protein kinase/WD40 repeat protein